MENNRQERPFHVVSPNIMPSAVHMLGIKDISSITGISEHQVRQLCKTNKIIHIRAGTKYLINYERFLDYLNGE